MRWWDWWDRPSSPTRVWWWWDSPPYKGASHHHPPASRREGDGVCPSTKPSQRQAARVAGGPVPFASKRRGDGGGNRRQVEQTFIGWSYFPEPAMKPKDRTNWQRAISRMSADFGRDYCNQSIYLAPWVRAVHSMVTAWRIRKSQSHLRRRQRCPSSVADWSAAVRLMTASLDRRAKEQALRGTWEYWAKHRPPLTNRYIRRDRRRSTSEISGLGNSSQS